MLLQRCLLLPALSVVMAVGSAGTAYSQVGKSALPLPPTSTAHLASGSYLDVIKLIEEDGYRVTEVKRTFLGRYRVLARNATQLREVIISSSTGAIMRDAIIRTYAPSTGEGAPATTASVPGTVTKNRSSNSGNQSELGAGVSAGTSSGSGGGSASVGASVGASIGGGSIGGGSIGGGLGIGD